MTCEEQEAAKWGEADAKEAREAFTALIAAAEQLFSIREAMDGHAPGPFTKPPEEYGPEDRRCLAVAWLDLRAAIERARAADEAQR